MNWFRKWRHKRFLAKQGLCPKHLVRKTSSGERIEKIMQDAGVDVHGMFIASLLFADTTCELCDIEKEERRKKRIQEAIEVVSK